MENFKFTNVSYKNYQPDTKETATYLNMRKDRQGNQFPALIAKLFNENPIKCVYKAPKLAYFDIETYDTELDFTGCPIASRQTSHISMISLIIDRTATLFHLDKYFIDVQAVRE